MSDADRRTGDDEPRPDSLEPSLGAHAHVWNEPGRPVKPPPPPEPPPERQRPGPPPERRRLAPRLPQDEGERSGFEGCLGLFGLAFLGLGLVSLLVNGLPKHHQRRWTPLVTGGGNHRLPRATSTSPPGPAPCPVPTSWGTIATPRPINGAAWRPVGHLETERQPHMLAAHGGAVYQIELGEGIMSSLTIDPVVGNVPRIGSGWRGYQDGGWKKAQFMALTAMAYGPDGTLYVAEDPFGAIRRVSSQGMVTSFWGDRYRHLLDRPTALGVDAASNLYVLQDSGKNSLVNGRPCALGRNVLRRRPSGAVEVVADLSDSAAGRWTMAVGRRGECYLAGGADNALWRVRSGRAVRLYSPTTRVPSPFLAIDGAGRVFMAGTNGGIDTWTTRGRQPLSLVGLPSPAPGYDAARFISATVDGKTLYALDVDGTLWARRI